MTTQSTAAALAHAAAGVTPKGSFACEARCFCPANDVVWVGERSGVITVRCARTGDIRDTVELSSATALFATAMVTTAQGEMWVGGTDGRICVFNIATKELVAELRNPETERGGEVHALGVEAKRIFVGMTSSRVCVWDAVNKTFVHSFVHTAAVQALVVSASVCYTGDALGNLSAWDVTTGERSAYLPAEEPKPMTAMEMDPCTSTLWCGHADGTVTVYNVFPHLALAETLTHAKGRINTLLHVGGKMWGAGMEKTTYVWQTQTRKLLGKTRDHSSFVFALGKLYSMETARVWSMSNDKTVKVYDGEGFFAPVLRHGAESEEVTAAYAANQALRMRISILEKQHGLERDKVLTRDMELEKAKLEVHKQMLKIHGLEHAVDEKEGAIHGSKADRAKLFTENTKLTATLTDIMVKLQTAEEGTLKLKGDVAVAEETVSRLRADVADKISKSAIADTERNIAMGDTKRLKETIQLKDDAIEKLNAEIRKMRDEAISAKVEIGKRERDTEVAKTHTVAVQERCDQAETKYRSAEEGRQRLDDLIIVRDAEARELQSRLRSAADVEVHQQQVIHVVNVKRDQEHTVAQRVEDDFAVKNHEYETVKRDRASLQQELASERQQSQECKSNEGKFRLQNEELRRQLEQEKNSVKMLEDQYTIFQFVINSRGELINSIWSLHGKLALAVKALRSLDGGIKQVDPTKDKLTLKREWKTHVVSRASGTVDSVGEVQRQVDYIIANYLSEYEKMHLGISAAKFTADAARPAVVGDQLLSKLRDGTLMKQFSHPQPGASADFVSKMPPPYNSTLSAAHIVPRGMPAAAATAPQPRPASAIAASTYDRTVQPLSVQPVSSHHSVRPM
jgi:WD40 repeat protein